MERADPQLVRYFAGCCIGEIIATPVTGKRFTFNDLNCNPTCLAIYLDPELIKEAFRLVFHSSGEELRLKGLGILDYCLSAERFLDQVENEEKNPEFVKLHAPLPDIDLNTNRQSIWQEFMQVYGNWLRTQFPDHVNEILDSIPKRP